ncbi:hypothetical protein HHI36_017152 [Cryptolaemus montrouzieri]|uniref:Uncharacterized protein n=1 Tax=Cryptolaemus montrouzieri TaxID=559131 RepID=A0ABD2NLM9_9CUCU
MAESQYCSWIGSMSLIARNIKNPTLEPGDGLCYNLVGNVFSKIFYENVMFGNTKTFTLLEEYLLDTQLRWQLYSGNKTPTIVVPPGSGTSKNEVSDRQHFLVYDNVAYPSTISKA